MSKVIEITVSPTGETRLQTKGFTGSSCQDASRLLEQALGTRVADTPTPEFYQAQATAAHRHQRSTKSASPSRR